MRPRRAIGSTPPPMAIPLEDRETTELAELRPPPDIRELVAPSASLRSAAAALEVDAYLLARKLAPLFEREGLSAATVPDAMLRHLGTEIELVAMTLVPEVVRSQRAEAFRRWLRF